MAMYKCKICGGDLKLLDKENICECEYCGSHQTVPQINDERLANLYERASGLRRKNEFDKAESIYEKLIEEIPNDPDLYWSMVLCRYGVEYVEERGSRKPTIHRMQQRAVSADPDYENAIRYADAHQAKIYQDSAAEIEQIQRGYQDIMRKEAPFDIFICYKETDERGMRTRDSVKAFDLYERLTKEGFKVFFARVTLENHLGEEYEPYIFAALQSSRVMVVLGTSKEHFEALWVRNEWNR